MKINTALYPVIISLVVGTVGATEYHVSVDGDDANPGTRRAPLRSIQQAADRAQPGDTITVHAGMYREWVNPPRGGVSEDNRIVYRAAEGAAVVIRGSEVIEGWQKVGEDTWKVTLPDTFFGDFNPFKELITGDWFNPQGRVHHLGAVYLDGHWLTEAASLDEVLKPAGENPLWFTPAPAEASGGGADSDDDTTTIWAQFKGVDPNRGNVEINVRPAVFYPSSPGVNFITVRGLVLEHAAPNWAPPTAEQVGLIGTHWSKGWVIEDNTIRYSVCTGLTLGKYGDDWDNRAQSAEGYVGTINRALAEGWSKAKIGHHIVRNNRISHCEQAGIVGSLGAAFSTVTGNTIHDIHVRRLFTGAEMAGIKFHAPIDSLISENHIYRTGRGIWLDWMTQGTRVTRNLLHDNGPREDLFVEVNHGPFLVDNNIFLSPLSLAVNSCGGAYVHNLIAGKISVAHNERRETPYHKPHSTEVLGLHGNPSGDDRYYNNLFVGGSGLVGYDEATLPVWMAGNVFFEGAKASKHEEQPDVPANASPGVKLRKQPDGLYLEITMEGDWMSRRRRLVTTELLGNAKVPGLPYEKPDGSPYEIDTDFLGVKRNRQNPSAGPFEFTGGGKRSWKLR